MQSQKEYQTLQDLTSNQVKPNKTINKAHLNSIQCVAGNSINKNFATGSHDHTIKIWDLEKTKQIMQLSDHKQGVWSLQYSKDCNQLLSASPDTVVQIWDSKKGSVGTRFKAHKDKVYNAKFNNSNQNVVSCGIGGEILVWDVKNSSKPIKTLNVKQMFAYYIEFSKNDQFMFVTTLGSKLYVFDGKTFELLKCQSLSEKQNSKCESCATNFDLFPNQVFIAGDKGTVSSYDFTRQTKKFTKRVEFTAHMDECRSVLLHPSKKLLCSTSRDGSVRLWNLTNDIKPKLTNNLVFHNQSVSETVFLDDWIITGSWDQNIGLWKTSDFLKF